MLEIPTPALAVPYDAPRSMEIVKFRMEITGKHECAGDAHVSEE